MAARHEGRRGKTPFGVNDVKIQNPESVKQHKIKTAALPWRVKRLHHAVMSVNKNLSHTVKFTVFFNTFHRLDKSK